MEVIDRLYCGGNETYSRVAGKPGWSWLRCCKENGPDCHRQVLGYTTLGAPAGPNYLAVQKGHLLSLNMIDVDDMKMYPDELIDDGLEFVNKRYLAGDKVLIACNSGMHRGPTMCLAYLRTIGEMPYASFKYAEHVFKTLYPKYDSGGGIRLKIRSRWVDLKDKFLKG